LNVVVDGKWSGRYTASRSAIAAPREWPVVMTYVVLYRDIVFCTAARTSGADLITNKFLIDYEIVVGHTVRG
jgi:hypothetical protein